MSISLINNIKSTASRFSAGYLGMVLGLIGTGMAWRYAAAEQGYPAVIGEVIIGAGCIVWLVLVSLFIIKSLCFTDRVTDEFRHPVASGFSSLLPATTVLVAMGLTPYLPLFAGVLFGLGAVAQLAYAAWLTGSQWKGNTRKRRQPWCSISRRSLIILSVQWPAGRWVILTLVSSFSGRGSFPG